MQEEVVDFLYECTFKAIDDSFVMPRFILSKQELADFYNWLLDFHNKTNTVYCFRDRYLKNIEQLIISTKYDRRSEEFVTSFCAVEGEYKKSLVVFSTGRIRLSFDELLSAIEDVIPEEKPENARRPHARCKILRLD
jgi:hypothetical protein